MVQTTSALIPVAESEVPKGRGSNPFYAPITEIAATLYASPGQWSIIGSGSYDERSRLNNAAALLSGGKYRSLAEYYEQGSFETRVSGAKDAPHASEFEVAVYSRFVPNPRGEGGAE